MLENEASAGAGSEGARAGVEELTGPRRLIALIRRHVNDALAEAKAAAAEKESEMRRMYEDSIRRRR